jgi:hypothetical protein
MTPCLILVRPYLDMADVSTAITIARHGYGTDGRATLQYVNRVYQYYIATSSEASYTNGAVTVAAAPPAATSGFRSASHSD